MEQDKKTESFGYYTILAVQVIGILVLLPLIALAVWGPWPLIDNAILIILILIALLPLPLWKQRKNLEPIFIISAIAGFVSTMFLVVFLYTHINAYFTDRQNKIEQIKSDTFIQEKNEELTNLIKEPILITAYDSTVLMTDKGFAIYLTPETQNYEAFGKFIQSNIVGKKFTVVFQGQNNTISLAAYKKGYYSGAFNIYNDLGHSQPFPGVELGCHCDLVVKGQLLDEMKFPN